MLFKTEERHWCQVFEWKRRLSNKRSNLATPNSLKLDRSINQRACNRMPVKLLLQVSWHMQEKPYNFYNSLNNRRSRLNDAIQENDRKTRLTLNFLHGLINANRRIGHTGKPSKKSSRHEFLAFLYKWFLMRTTVLSISLYQTYHCSIHTGKNMHFIVKISIRTRTIINNRLQ